MTERQQWTDNKTPFLLFPLQIKLSSFLYKKAGKITEINHIDKPDKLHLAGRVNRVPGHAVWSEAERRVEQRGEEREGGRERASVSK